MSHNRKFVISGVSLTKGRTHKHILPVMEEVRDELEKIILNNNFLEKAPFKWVGLTIRFGLKDEKKIHYRKISKKHGDVSVAIEIDTNTILKADRDELKNIILKASLNSLINIGEKYDLPNKKFIALMSNLK